MLRLKVVGLLWSEVRLNRLAMATGALSSGVAILRACLQQNAAGLRTVRRRRRQGSSHRCQAPFLDIGLDKHKASLSKVDVYSCGSVGPNSGEEVWIFQAMHDIVQFLAVSGEENATSSWSVSAADHVALHKWRTVRSLVEGHVKALESIREVGCRVFVEACHGVSVSENSNVRNAFVASPKNTYLVA